MVVTLYGMKHSHPVLAARLMLERKQLRHNVRDVLPGLHPFVVRAAGFPGRTVPAVRIDSRFVQGTLSISRALDEIVPAHPLFPADPAARAAVESAERWAHDELQPVATRIFRWAGRVDNGVRAWIASEVIGWPAPNLLGRVFAPVMAYYAQIVDADAAHVERDLAGLEPLLDRADELVAAGVLGGAERNAADCQALACLRLLMAHEELRPLVEDRPCGQAALVAVPNFPPGPRVSALVPAALPPHWLPTA